METDILEILESKSEEPFIKNTKKLIREMLKIQEANDLHKQKEEVKTEINKLLEKKFPRVKEIYNNGQIDEEKLDFALKLINKNKDLFNQINELKKKKEKEKKLKELIELKEHLEYTKKELKEKIDKINTQPIAKTSLIKRIIKKTKTEELEIKLNEIINIIDESKIIHENKELKESYSKINNIHETLDILYKKCRIKNIQGIQEINKTIQKQYKEIIDKINSDINNLQETSKSEKKYDERLIEYVYNKQKNYVSQSIDNIENNKIYIQLLITLKLIKSIEKNKIKITYISPSINKTKNQLQNIKRKK